MVFFTRDIFVAQEFGGISRYFVELACQLIQRGVSLKIDAGHGFNGHLQQRACEDLDLKKRLVHCGGAARSWPKAYRVLGAAVSGLRERRADLSTVFHRTYYPVVEVLPKHRLVTTVHDLIAERLTADSGWRPVAKSFLKRSSATSAEIVIAVSETTKKDLIELWNIPEEKIRVIPHGATTVQGPATPVAIDYPFVLFVGNRCGYKNFRSLLQALVLLRARGIEIGVVAVGGGAFTASEQDSLKELKIQHLARQCSANDATLASLYRHAEALVVPSYYEGFGLPVLEAMQAGCVVCCSNTPALLETAGSGAAFFEPASEEALAEVLAKVLTDGAMRDRLRAAGAENLQRYSWQKCADQHLAVYEELGAR